MRSKAWVHALTAAGTIALLLGAGGPPPGVAAGPRPWVAAQVLRRLGSLAFRWRGHLWTVVGGQVHDLGPGELPVWNSSGTWVAYLQFSANRGVLWLARSDGQDRHAVSGFASVGQGGYTWVPGTDDLVVAPSPAGYVNGHPIGRPQGLWWLSADTARRRHLVGGVWVNAMATGSTAVAYSILLPPTIPVRRSTALEVVALSGGPARRLLTARHAGIEVAAVIDQRVLFWVDPLDSASLAADGLPLYSMPLTGGAVRRLGVTLPYPGWVVPAESGAVDIVAGGPRTVWQSKHLETCGLASGDCHRVAGNPHAVALDPAFCPTSQSVAFVQARDLGPAWGIQALAPLRAWVDSRTLWVAHGGSLREIPAAGHGVYQPQCTAHPADLLFVRDGGVWLVNLNTGRSREVVGGFLSQTPSALFGYYGYRTDIADNLAWVP